MKIFKVTYPLIDGRYIATIKLDKKIIHEEEFRYLNEAVDFTNAFCEGYRKCERALCK